MKVNEGDVVQIDESLVYRGYVRKYKAIVLWNGINNQPLLTKVGEYRPHWGTYKAIAEIIGHVDLNNMTKQDMFEGTFLNREDYVNVGDIMDCLSEITVSDDVVRHAVGLIEWAMGKRAISEMELWNSWERQYCDDLVSGIEVALSKERLDKLWETYNTDLRQRKIGDKCKELHIATRWSVHDVIGRLAENYEGDERAKFITLSALDENDESNFDYPYGVGFSTKFYHEQRNIMEDVNWRALYMNQPIERLGLLYDAQELQRYFELPDMKPDAIISVCDTKDRGSDDCVMPVAFKYGEKYFIEGILCDNSNPDIVDARLIDMLLKYNVHMSCFESNSAGGRVAQTVQEGVRAKGGRTKIVTKYTTANKETKIIVNSPWVKEHCLFKDDSVSDREYKKAVSKLCSYTTAGKNKHDDVPDAFAQLAEYAQSFMGATVQVIPRPF